MRLTSFVNAILPPHIEMPRIEDWEQKHLGNLSGMMRVDWMLRAWGGEE